MTTPLLIETSMFLLEQSMSGHFIIVFLKCAQWTLDLEVV